MEDTARIVSFRESATIIAKIDNYAKERGIDRSGFLRMIIREKLKEAAVK